MTVVRVSFVYFLYYCASVFEIVSTPTELIWFNIKVQHCFKVEFCGSKPHKNDDLENSD